MPRGAFVVLEGVDGAGSTTQTKLLTDYLIQKGHRAIATKEPTTGKIGRLIREYLSSTATDSAVDALLFAADRVEHLETVVKPALNRGEHVISDRYLESTLAYQKAEGIDIEWLELVNRFAIRPDCVMILDIDPETSLSRKPRDGRERFETVGFLREVRQNFKRRAKLKGYHVVDATKPIMQVHETLREIVTSCIEGLG